MQDSRREQNNSGIQARQIYDQSITKDSQIRSQGNQKQRENVLRQKSHQIAQSLEAPEKLNLSAPKNQTSKKAPRRRDSGASASVKSQDKSSRALARGVCCTTCSVEQWRRGRRRRGQETGGVKYMACLSAPRPVNWPSFSIVFGNPFRRRNDPVSWFQFQGPWRCISRK